MSFLFQSRAAVLQAEAQQALVEKMIELEQVKLKALELEMDVKHMKIMADEREALKEHNGKLRNALVGMMACTLRADVPADIYDAAEKALKGDV